MIWLLDGQSFEQTASFIQQDGRIWIPRIRRDLNGRNVTYRAIQDDGRISEVNTTIKVTCMTNILPHFKKHAIKFALRSIMPLKYHFYFTKIFFFLYNASFSGQILICHIDELSLFFALLAIVIIKVN
jgi:hypothetical protein